MEKIHGQCLFMQSLVSYQLPSRTLLPNSMLAQIHCFKCRILWVFWGRLLQGGRARRAKIKKIFFFFLMDALILIRSILIHRMTLVSLLLHGLATNLLNTPHKTKDEIDQIHLHIAFQRSKDKMYSQPIS